MKIPFEIKKISILIGQGTDRLTFYLDGPTLFPSMGYEMLMHAEAQAHCGETYVKLHFPGVPVEIIDMTEVPIAVAQRRGQPLQDHQTGPFAAHVSRGRRVERPGGLQRCDGGADPDTAELVGHHHGGPASCVQAAGAGWVPDRE